VRLGITLPVFSKDARAVIATALDAEEHGIHGVFLFDHLWPMGGPNRPALSLFPTAAAVIASTRHIRVGTLVARVGLLPDEVVVASLANLARLAEDRLIAGIGTGDVSSEDENRRLGLPHETAGSRRERLGRIADLLGPTGVELWIGGGGEATNEVARTRGVTLNLWGVAPEELAAEVSSETPLSWAGPLPKEASEAAGVLRGLQTAGATWAVWGWPRSTELVVDAAGRAGVELA
jgi:Luciferase-like monooxygenase